MCDQAEKHSADQVLVNSSMWHPITTPESPGLSPTTDSEVIIPLDWIQPRKVDSSPPCRGGKGNGWLLSPKSCMAHHTDRMAGGTAECVAWSSPYSKQWKEQPLSALLAWATDNHQEAHIPARGILQRVVALQTPILEPPLVNMAATWDIKAPLGC